MSELGPTRTYSNPTATEVLRRLLDECGVEWWAEDDPEDPPYYLVTKWFSNANEQTFEEIPAIRSRSLKAFCITPEQAIDATLGRGTCRRNRRKDGYAFCSECGYNITGPWAHWCPNCGRKVDA